MRLKRWKRYCLSGVLLVLVGAKLLLPGFSGALRSRAERYFGPCTDYVAALETLGADLSLRAQREEPAPIVPAVRQEIAEESVAAGERGEVVPEVVAVFLAQQASFTAVPLPEKVDGAWYALPFDSAVPVSGRNSSGFGYRLHPILNTVRFHYGTDFAACSGDTVLAFADGTVTFAGYDNSFGWHLRIDHGGGWETHYAHCSVLYVREGQRVACGDCVALVGATGLATGPHLHFELIKDGKYVNPEYYVNG